MGIATFVAILTLTLFVITLRPDVGGTEDSPKFQFVGRVLGTSHSPGYPFYAIATWAFGWLPIGNLAYRINLFSAVCGALSCVVVLPVNTSRLTKYCWPSSIRMVMPTVGTSALTGPDSGGARSASGTSAAS